MTQDRAQQGPAQVCGELTLVNEAALEAATQRIYEDKGDRKGVLYVGWDHEPESVKTQWREDVRVSIVAYLAALPRQQHETEV